MRMINNGGDLTGIHGFTSDIELDIIFGMGMEWHNFIVLTVKTETSIDFYGPKKSKKPNIWKLEIIQGWSS